MRALPFLLACLAAGPVGAGPQRVEQPDATAWVATYRLQDARGARTLVVVCDDTRLEMRTTHGPTRVWMRRGLAIEHQEVFAPDRRVVAFSAGDLKARNRIVDWPTIRGLVPASLHVGIGQPSGNWHGLRVTRYAIDGNRVDWLVDAGLPSRYSPRGMKSPLLALTRLEHVRGSDAFSSTDDYREMDAADLGDEQLDDFARQFVLEGF